MTLPKQLSLDAIRSSLIRQEETIIFALIERAQFKRNTATCEPGHAAFASVLRPSARTFLDHMLLEHERLHATVRRYASPEEHAFFPARLPAPSLQQLPSSGGVLVPNGINVNEQIRALYESTIIPSICAEGDDEQYGSATLCDIAALQAISKRVHYGKFVAESKFRSQTEEYTALIRARDAAGLMVLLTNSAVEERLLRRVRAKASTYGQDIEDPTSAPAPPGAGAGVASPKVDPETIVALYRDHVIPLTKEVEVLYLLQRLEGCNIACADGRARRAADAHFAGAPRAALHFAPAPSVAAVMSAVLSGKAQYGVLPLETAASTLDVPTVHALSISALRVCADVLLHDPPLVLAARAAGPASTVATVHGPMASLREASDWLAEVAPDALLQTLPALADLRAFAHGLDARVRARRGPRARMARALAYGALARWRRARGAVRVRGARPRLSRVYAPEPTLTARSSAVHLSARTPLAFAALCRRLCCALPQRRRRPAWPSSTAPRRRPRARRLAS